MNTGPQSAGSSNVATACGSECTTCSGLTMRSQYRVTALKASLTVSEGSWKCSTCCSTGSGIRLRNVSPEISNSGSRLEWATAAAVTMFVAPGPIDDVATMI